ncbi:MAG: hypothetical protein RE471_05050 [Ferroplasma sp.]|jgi:hypothetical protein|uniref:hypothetical protein n=1 Tax=Ferroplasma sp. TaxID=2591003 RepID=UPI0028157E40|nr:hypothetical protein [Ferroplasma sp.]WMT52249.1 MAG: hypothetical protein RE471_05050 [Ferroplasma sp.]
MFNIQQAVDEFIYSKFINDVNEIYVLKGFYDININDSIYYRINMMVIQNERLIIFRLSTRICSINIGDINRLRIFLDYRKLNFKISARQ